MTTLTVDDNPIILRSIQEVLTRLDPEGDHHTADSGEKALALARQLSPDVVFLDIEMPDIHGLEVAQRLYALRKQTNLVFITGHGEYALNAFELYASGFLLKPITQEHLRRALEHLRYPVSDRGGAGEKRLKVRCFGQFEVWCGGEPLQFQRSRTKELFAYLIDRNGAMCSTQQLLSILWPESPGNESHASQLRVFIADLQTTLTRCGLAAVLLRRRGWLGVETSLLDCDYYRYLSGEGRGLFHGEYMSQYAFAEVTLATIFFREKR